MVDDEVGSYLLTPQKGRTPIKSTPLRTPKGELPTYEEEISLKFPGFKAPTKTPTPPRKQPLRTATPAKVQPKVQTPQKSTAQESTMKQTMTQLTRFDTNPSFRQFLTSVDLLRPYQSLCKESTLKKRPSQQRNKLGTPSQDDYFSTFLSCCCLLRFLRE